MDKDEGFDPAINLTGSLPEEFSKRGCRKVEGAADCKNKF